MSLIAHLFKLWPDPRLLLQLGLLQAIMAVVQGLLLGLLVPILRALLRAQPDISAAMPWLLAGGIGMIAYAALSIIATPVGFAAAGQLALQLRLHLMNHVSRLPLGWFTTERKARLSRAVTTDIGHIAQLAVVIGGPAITSSLLCLTVLIITMIVDWRMGALFLGIAVLALLALRRSGRIADIAVIRLEQANTELAGRAIEYGQAQPVMRAAGLCETGSAPLRRALDEHRRIYREGMDRSMLPDLTYTGIVMAGTAGVLVLGAHLLLEGANSVATTVALLVLAVRFIEPLGHLINLNGALREMDNSITRVMDILDTPALPEKADPVRVLPDTSIEFDRVSFSYGATPALVDVSFRCAPGSVTALVGASGSGKTTAIHLIARFYDVAGGGISIGGVDVRDFDQAAMMGDIAIIFQDVYLFDDTIEENLRFAKPDATEADLMVAIRSARLDEVIERLPHGLKSLVGEGGTQLSGGERQRVSIARAFLKGSRIVLIDEASSALDPENEAAFGGAIAGLAADPDRTVIVIAHRPATLNAVDQVVVLDEGRVVEAGAPDALRKAGGRYSTLYSQCEAARSWTIGAPPPPGLGPKAAQTQVS